MAVMAVDLDGPAAVKERLEAFASEVLAEATNRPVQLANGSLYMRGLIEQGPRRSLEPMVARLGGEADYESLQNFLAASPWGPAAVSRAVAERVAPEIEVVAIAIVACLGAALTLPAAAVAAGSIAGKTTDAETGNPAPFVSSGSDVPARHSLSRKPHPDDLDAVKGRYLG